MFSCQHSEVVPDMLVKGKGVGGGFFPLAALLAREDLDVVPEGALGHYTHEKNPVACAAGLATIECLEADGLLENARVLGQRALARIGDMMERHELVGGARGLGLLLGIELVKDRKTRGRASEAAERVMHRSLEKGPS